VCISSFHCKINVLIAFGTTLVYGILHANPDIDTDMTEVWLSWRPCHRRLMATIDSEYSSL
jgi:hypothetical protein